MTDTQASLGSKRQTRDLDEYFDQLSAWVKEEFECERTNKLLSIRPTSEDANGFAGESFVIEVQSGDTKANYLLKRKPTKHIFFPDQDFDAEYRIQELLHRSNHCPVAPTFGYKESAEVLGSPFYVLGFVAGRPTPDRPPYYACGWLKDGSAELQRATANSGIRALAQLHSKSISDLGADFLLRAKGEQTELQWDLARWDRFNSVAWRSKPLQLAVETRKWLEENQPTQGDLVVSWGDARPGNMLFLNANCNAIVDWDLVTVGEPEKDLAYWLVFDNQFKASARAMGLQPNLPGWLSDEQTISAYCDSLGRDVDRDKLAYFRVYAAWQCGIMYARFMTMREDLSDQEWSSYITEQAPPLAMMRNELARL